MAGDSRSLSVAPWPAAAARGAVHVAGRGAGGHVQEAERRRLGGSDPRSTIRQLLKKYYFQEQNKKIPRAEKRHHFL